MLPARASRHFSGTIGKAFDVLSAFATARPELTATELADATGLDRSTIHRFLSTLVQLGALRQDTRTRRYRLGLRMLDYAHVLLDSLEIRRIAVSHLQELHRDVSGTLSLGLPDGGEVVLVERTFGPWATPGGFDIGQRLPMYASATGLAILANLAPGEAQRILEGLRFEPRTARTVRGRAALERRLDETRRLGYSVSDEELLPGLRSLAVPIRGPDGWALAAVSLAHRTSVSPDLAEFVAQFAPRLQSVAERISAALGYRPLGLPVGLRGR
jgi:IclR family pca regulon transcriptional regulator